MDASTKVEPTMKDRIVAFRVLRLLADPASAEQLADQVGCSPKQVRRVIEWVRSIGAQVEAVEFVEGGKKHRHYMLRAPWSLPFGELASGDRLRVVDEWLAGRGYRRGTTMQRVQACLDDAERVRARMTEQLGDLVEGRSLAELMGMLEHDLETALAGQREAVAEAGRRLAEIQQLRALVAALVFERGRRVVTIGKRALMAIRMHNIATHVDEGGDGTEVVISVRAPGEAWCEECEEWVAVVASPEGERTCTTCGEVATDGPGVELSALAEGVAAHSGDDDEGPVAAPSCGRAEAMLEWLELQARDRAELAAELARARAYASAAETAYSGSEARA
jgi:biotin operon repressor